MVCVLKMVDKFCFFLMKLSLRLNLIRLNGSFFFWMIKLVVFKLRFVVGGFIILIRFLDNLSDLFLLCGLVNEILKVFYVKIRFVVIGYLYVIWCFNSNFFDFCILEGGLLDLLLVILIVGIL